MMGLKMEQPQTTIVRLATLEHRQAKTRALNDGCTLNDVIRFGLALAMRHKGSIPATKNKNGKRSKVSA